MVPVGVIRPMLLPICVNQRLPSGPAVISSGSPFRIGNSVIFPAGVILPTFASLLEEISVNQRLPSGPAVILTGKALGVGIGNWVIFPLAVILPILFPLCSTNQKLPSGPNEISFGRLLA